MKTITYNPDTHRLVPVEPNNTELDLVDPGFGTRKEAWERILASFPQPEPVEVEPVAIATYVGYRTNDGDVCKRVEIKRLKYIPEHTLLYTAPPDYEEIKRQLEEYRKDAERYRAIKRWGGAPRDGSVAANIRLYGLQGEEEETFLNSIGEDLDQAIDAALASVKGGVR